MISADHGGFVFYTIMFPFCYFETFFSILIMAEHAGMWALYIIAMVNKAIKKFASESLKYIFISFYVYTVQSSIRRQNSDMKMSSSSFSLSIFSPHHPAGRRYKWIVVQRCKEPKKSKQSIDKNDNDNDK